jgi:hypothetical protein
LLLVRLRRTHLARSNELCLKSSSLEPIFDAKPRYSIEIPLVGREQHRAVDTRNRGNLEIERPDAQPKPP